MAAEESRQETCLSCPHVVTTQFRKIEWNTEKKKMSACMPAIRVMTLKYVNACDDSIDDIGFGVCDVFNSPLLSCNWSSSMDNFDVTCWAWFLLLIIDGLQFRWYGFSSAFEIYLVYKLHPEQPLFYESVNKEMQRIMPYSSTLTRLQNVSISFFTNMDRACDPALSFDTTWIWERAGKLLQVDLPDLRLTPGITYRRGPRNPVLDKNGRWHETSRDYISWRILVAGSSSPLSKSQKGKLIDFLNDIAKSGEKLSSMTSLDVFESSMKGINFTNIMDKEMRKAFRAHSGVISNVDDVPEIKNALHHCDCCSLHETPTQKLLKCACGSVFYCDVTCQKNAWGRHKQSCSFKKK